jgi:hypothetical protein
VIRLLLLGVLLLAGCGKDDASLEDCLACGENVSVNAKLCPHCGEPNPSQSIRDAIVKEQREELTKKAAESAAAVKALFGDYEARQAEEARVAQERLAQMPAAYQPLRRVIERLAKEKGALPDEDAVAKVTFDPALRDPWTLPFKFSILDAKSGRYILTSAGPDLSYGTEDDFKLECVLGKE